MNKSFKKLLLRLHLIIGIITGVVIVIEGLTGAIYVFAGELSDFLYEDRRFIKEEPQGGSLLLSEMVAICQDTLQVDFDPVRIYFPDNPKSTIAFPFQKTDEHAILYTNYMSFFKTVYINPYSGEIVAIENSKWEFFNVVMYLHMTLLLGYELGAKIVGWSVLAFVFMLISGLILWWPKNQETRKKRTWFRWKPHFSWKRKTFDLHVVAGFYSLFIALILALTGLFWAFGWFGAGVKWIANGGQDMKYVYEKVDGKEPLPYDSAIDNIKHLVENDSIVAHSHVIKYPRVAGRGFSARAYLSDEVIYDRINYYFDAETGRLTGWDNFEMLTNGDKVSAINYDIHVGSIGRLPTKILAFLISLIIASLPITGFLIWRNKSYDV